MGINGKQFKDASIEQTKLNIFTSTIINDLELLRSSKIVSSSTHK